MGIESNDTAAPIAQPAASTGPSFTSASSAPAGTPDFLSLSNRIGISRIDSSVEPYLEKVMKLVKENLNNVNLIRLDTISNAYAIRYDGPDGLASFFGIQFVSMGDPVSPKFYPASIKLRLMKEELARTFANERIRISDARVIIGGYGPDMERAFEMADTIVRTFRVTADSSNKNATIDSLVTNEFAADWRLAEARNAESALSPHGTRPRLDIGLTLKAKIRNEMSGREFREMDADYRLLGVVGGYVEIREKEVVVGPNNQQVLMYQPIFNITVLNAVIPLEGVASILLAALAPTIYNTYFWARQWQDLSDGQPQPGLLEENPEKRGQPFHLKDQEELHEFVRTYFAKPHIAFQFQDGRDNIPGLWRLGSTDIDQKNTLINRLTNFFGTESENVGNVELSRIIETRYDGVYGSSDGILHDSRDIDYLYIAARQGFGSITREMRGVLLGNSENPEDRARIVQISTNSFTPIWFDSVAVVNADFIKWIVNKTDRRNLLIVDPNSHTEARSIGSILDGFGSGSGIGSIVTNGVTRGGLGLGSFWSYGN